MTAVADPAAGHDAPPDSHPWARRVGLGIAAVLIVADQLTKELVERTLERGQFVPLLGEGIGWQLVYNPGGAFGLGAPTWVFFVVTVAVTVIVLRTLPRSPGLLPAVSYGMLLAGALGNALDRLLRPSVTGVNQGWFSGDVVDFVAWGSFPRFNVADASITVGVTLLVLAFLADERRHRRERAAQGDQPESADNGADIDDGADSDDEPGR